VIRFQFRSICQVSLASLHLAGALVLVAGAACAQLPGNTSDFAQRCNSPLGSLEPDCQAAKASFDLPATRRNTPINLGGPAAVRMPSAKPPIEEPRPPVAPEAPPQAPTEFQGFVASCRYLARLSSTGFLPPSPRLTGLP
jgi:hypothetical protein